MKSRSLQRSLVLRLSLALTAITASGLAGFVWHALELDEAASSPIAHEVIWEFLVDVAWAVPLGCAFAVFVAALVVRRGLAPLRELAARVQAIRPGAPLPRLSNATLPDELVPLVVAFDEAAARLDGALATQKRFTANAAHELRTPLTVLSGRLDRLLESPVTTEDILTLQADCVRMTRVVAQLTALARAESIAAAADARTVIAPLLREVACGLAPLATSRDVSIGVHVAAEQLTVRGTAEAVEAMLRNVIENAVQHAPAGTEVAIRIGADALVEVEDAGPGIPIALRSQAFERFWRGPWSRHTGSGLGLAIVGEAAAQIGAAVTLGDAPSGGACVALRFRPG
ncbi:MAG: HAMP domain-containing histidine kinase [Roseomonas sp.]|nr:HAMP domain-containing histidine kinase [Roseomonas sp.]